MAIKPVLLLQLQRVGARARHPCVRMGLTPALAAESCKDGTMFAWVGWGVVGGNLYPTCIIAFHASSPVRDVVALQEGHH